MNFFKYTCLFVFGVGFITASQAAISVEQTQEINTKNQMSEIAQTIQAKEWGLSDKEWQRYQTLMDGQLGIYSPNIDPLTALGISARSEQERRHYAELQVMAESARINRELAYQRAYDEAFKRLYPDLLPVNFNQTLAYSPIINTNHTQNNRLAVFVEDNCTHCEKKVQELLVQGVAFDLYMVGSGDDDTVIRRWANKIKIEPKKVFSREITLNHDAGRWQALQIGGTLPAVLKEVDGQWQRQ